MNERIDWARERIAQLEQEIRQLEEKQRLYNYSFAKPIAQATAKINALRGTV